MARYVKDLVLNKPEDFVSFMMNDYLQKNQFAMSDWKGEAAYRAGDPMMEGYKYLKWHYSDGTLHLEAWLKGSFGGEWNLDGFVGTLQKKPYRASLEQLFEAMQQEIPAGTQDGRAAAQGIPVQTVDNTKAATLALVLGLVSVALGILWPLIGILCAVVAFSQARMGSGSSKAGMAKAGKILSIVGVVLAIVVWVLSAVALAL